MCNVQCVPIRVDLPLSAVEKRQQVALLVEQCHLRIVRMLDAERAVRFRIGDDQSER